MRPQHYLHRKHHLFDMNSDQLNLFFCCIYYLLPSCIGIMINQAKDPVMNQSGNHGTSFRGFAAHMVCLQGPLIFTSPLCAAVALSGSLVASSLICCVTKLVPEMLDTHVFDMYRYIYIQNISYDLEVNHHRSQ